MRKLILISAFALTLSLSMWFYSAYAWYDNGYAYRVPITASCSECSGDVDAFVLVGGEDGITISGRKQLIWCNVTVSTTDSTVGYLYYDDNTDYVCINGDDDNYFVTSVDEGQGSNNGTTEDNLALWYHMNTTTDSTKFGNDFTVSGATQTSSGKFGGAYSFDGGDYLETDAPPMVWNTSTFTIMAWVKQSVQADVDNIYSLNNFDGAAGAGLQTAIQADGDLQLQVSTVGSWSFDLVTTDQPISTGTWYHIAFVANDTHFIAYINGTEWASDDYATWGSATAMNSKIGVVHYDVSGYTNWFNGIIDEFRLYNRTLSADEIRRAYNSSSYAGSEEAGSGDSVPTSTLISPADDSTDPDGDITFNCTCADDKDIDNVTFWNNGTGTWHANYTNTSVDGTWAFAERSLSFGITRQDIIWNCLCVDNASQSDWANSNYTVSVETGTPYMIQYTSNNITTTTEQGMYSVHYGDFNNDYEREYIWSPFTESTGRDKEVHITKHGVDYLVFENGTGGISFSEFAHFLNSDFDNDGVTETFVGRDDYSDSHWFVLQINDSNDVVQSREIDTVSDSNSDHPKPIVALDCDADGYDEYVTGFCSSGEVIRINNDGTWGGLTATLLYNYASTTEDFLGYDIDDDGDDEVYLVEGFASESLTTITIHALFFDGSCDIDTDTSAWTNTSYTRTYLCENFVDLDEDGDDEFVMPLLNDITNTLDIFAFDMAVDGTLSYAFTVDSISNVDDVPWFCWTGDHDLDGDNETVLSVRSTSDDLTNTAYMWDCPSGTCTRTTLYSGIEHSEASTERSPYLRTMKNHPSGTFAFAGFIDDALIWNINYTLPIINRTHFDAGEKISIKYTPFDSLENATSLTVHREFWCNDTRMVYEAQMVNNATEYEWVILPGNTSAGDVCHGSFRVDDGYENSTMHNSTVATIFADTTPPTVTIDNPGNITYTSVPIDINVTSSEDTDTCQYMIDSGSNTTMTGSGTDWDAEASPSEGTRHLEVYCNDTSNNWGYTDIWFSYDGTKPTITVDSPDNTTYNSEPINVNITVSEDAANCTWAIGGGTNYSMNNDSMTDWHYPLTGVPETTNVLWIYCQDLAGHWGLNNSIAFTYDVSAPVITINTPDNISYTEAPVSISVSTDETANWCGYNLNDDANTSLSGAGTSWSGSVSPPTDGLHLLNVYCNDTYGFMGFSSVWFTYSPTNYTETFNNYTYETASETFSITFNLSQYSTIDNITAVLVWNGTTYSDATTTISDPLNIISKTITIPDATEDNYNVSFYWNYTINYIGGTSENVQTTANNQTIYIINITNCTSGDIGLRFFLKDEDTEADVEGAVDMTILVTGLTGGYTTNKNVSFGLVGRSNYSLCLGDPSLTYTLSADIYYNATGYDTRTYYLTDAEIDNVANNITLYLGTGDAVIVYVKDGNNNLVPDIIIDVQRYYPSTGSYKTITILRTDGTGKDITYLTLNTVYYRFTLEQDGTVVKEYSAMLIADTVDDPEELTLFIPQELSEYFQIRAGLTWSCTYIASTNTTSCSVSDPSGLATSIDLNVRKKQLLGGTEVCDVSDSGASVTLGCYLNETRGEEFFYTLTAETADGNTYLLEQNYLMFEDVALFGTYGLFIAIFIVLVCSLLGIHHPPVAGIMAVAGLVISTVFQVAVIGWGALISLGMIAMIMAIKGRG